MELLPPISASLGAMVSLAGKLDALQLDTELKDELQKLKTRLLKLSKAPDPPATVRTWMNDVRELSYDMDNCVDAGEDWFDQMPGFKACVKEANGLYDRYISESVPSLAEVVPIAGHRLLTVDSGRNHTDLAVGLYGTGGPVDKLCHLLTDGDERLKVVSILGVGGIGKTTLAKKLWRKHKTEDHFHCRAFVRSAKKPDMRRILRSILAQVRPHQPPDANEVHELIHDLNEHLKDKRYFIIIDDLWTKSVWDIARRAFPKGNHGSRIVTTTEVEDVALAFRSRYPSSCIFQMEPLSDSHAKELFTSAVFRPGEQLSPQVEEVSDEIIRRCAGLPQAIISISSVLANQGKAYTVQQWEQVLIRLPANTTSAELLKHVIKFCYNCLPCCLQTCLLYLSIYPENYVILKEDIVKQWVAEGFIHAPTEKDKIKVAGNYFDKLVSMGLIQHIDVDYSDEVLYYAVHHTVHNLIMSKSTEQNFITVMDYSQSTVGFSNKVSRLSLQFGSATYATRPEIIGQSQVRSLAFIGLKICLPSLLEFKLLRFLTLHMWSDQPNTGVDLKPTSELVLLRSLQVKSNDTVYLPDLMKGPIHLEILEINARVADIPANIVHLRSWLHLRLGVGTEQPDVTGILKNVTLNPPISLDESSSPPDSVKTIDLLSPIGRIPKWVGQLTNLRILKFVVRALQRDDISNLHGLTFLTVLSLHVQQRTREPIGFAKDAFTALEYFEFRCGVLRLLFQEGTMPNLRRLGLGFNARRGEQYDRLLIGINDMLSIQKITVLIGSAPGAEETDLKAAESAFKVAIGKHPSNVSVKRVDMVEEEYDLPEKQHLLQEKDASSEQHGIPKQKFVEDIKKNSSVDSQFIQRIKYANSNDYISATELLHITDGFSERRLLGMGQYGSVYKGQLKDGEMIAVKKLHAYMGIVNDEMFKKEYLNLASLEHPNIVRLVGYCNETQEEYMMVDGKMINYEIHHMALCFEYMCKGSLAKYLSDESTGEDWNTRYAIIKGMCVGLKYLHEELDPPVYHLDLKPDNILLDENMNPKIADFGLTQLFGGGRTRLSASTIGTIGYMPPEYIYKQRVSRKVDIFSLGVIIIKLMTGPDGYSQALDMSSEEFIELTHGKWRKRLQQTSNDSIASYAEQVKTCIRIALSCLEDDPHKRPKIGDIVSVLDLTENTAQFSHAFTVIRGSTAVEEEMSPSMPSTRELVDVPESKENELLNVHCRQLHFPFFDPNKSIACPLRLSNNTDADVAFRVHSKSPKIYIDELLNCSGIVPPRSSCTYLVLLKNQPPGNLDEFDVTLESCIAHSEVADADDNFIPEIVELTEGNKVHEVTLMASICDQAGQKMISELIGRRTKIICSNMDRRSYIVTMDTHPTEPWIALAHFDGYISVWNYETEARVMKFRIFQGAVRSVIFIARKQWIVAGDNEGEINVRSYVTTDEVKKFHPHSTWIFALAVHPNLPLLLSGGEEGLIKLWDWEKDWMCLRTFKNTPSYETIMFNPNNDYTGSITFMNVSMDGTAKTWNTSHPLPIAKYNCKSDEEVACFDYLQQDGGEYIVTGSIAGTARVWDLKTQKCVQQIPGLQTGRGINVGIVDCSPGHPLLVVALKDNIIGGNTVGLYNLATSRYENIFIHKFRSIRRFVYIKAIRSVAIAHEDGLTMLEIP